jgi:vacuolar protein sorting-associated protein 35
LNLVKQPVFEPGTIQIIDRSVAQPFQRAPYTMLELYDCVQYCPRVLPRLYLQITAGSALIKSGEAGAKWVLNDLEQAVRCEQNPIRGLFLRNYLLTALRDKLPDEPAPHRGTSQLETIQSGEELDEPEITTKGNVKDSYEFILGNFMEMNKLWVRIQHLPGEGNNKDVSKRRQRERNDLRILVGTNLVRLSQMECVTSKIYGEVILPTILEHIVVSGDPLSQAYLMDCLVQVFPDEYHIETLPILLNVCSRLRDKVNIRTILQGLMDRLANYLADEELLDESDTNQVKKTLARDSFSMFDECIQKVYNARGPKLTSKEVIRLQTALLQFSLKCYPENMAQVSRCLGVCVSALRQANASYEATDATMANVPEETAGVIKGLDQASVVELEKLLSIPLDTLGLTVLELDHYGALISFLPRPSRREVGMNMLKAVDKLGSTPRSVKEIEELFAVIQPLLSDGTARQVGGPPGPHGSFNEMESAVNAADMVKEGALVSKLVHLLHHEDTDVYYDMLNVARNHISQGGPQRTQQTLVAIVFAAVRLAQQIFKADQGDPLSDQKSEGESKPIATPSEPKPEGEASEAEANAEAAGSSEVQPTEEALIPAEADGSLDVQPAEEALAPTKEEEPEADASPPAEEAEAAPVEVVPAEETEGPPAEEPPAPPDEEPPTPPDGEPPVPPTEEPPVPPTEEPPAPPTEERPAPPTEEPPAPPTEEPPAPPTEEPPAPPTEEPPAPPTDAIVTEDKEKKMIRFV